MRRRIAAPHLYWSEQGYQLLGPMNRGTLPQPAKTTAIPGLAAEHWWIAKVCTAPWGLGLSTAFFASDWLEGLSSDWLFDLAAGFRLFYHQRKQAQSNSDKCFLS